LSIGAARPKFRTCVEMSGASAKNVVSGYCLESTWRSVRRYAAVGAWSGLSAIRIWASAGEISAPSLSDRLIPEYGVPSTSSMVSISSGGITVRIVRSIAASRFSVSSMRVPGTPRTCSLMSPASTVGKKSRPMSG